MDERKDTPPSGPIFVRLRARFRPQPPQENPPTSWKETFSSWNRTAMRIADGIPKLLAEAIDGLRSIVRGLANLPSDFGAFLRKGNTHIGVEEEIETKIIRLESNEARKELPEKTDD